MAKVNFHQKLKTIKGDRDLTTRQPKLDETGNPLRNEDGTPVMEEIVMTLQDVCSQALLTPHNDEKDISGEEKHRRYAIAKRIMRAPEDEPIIVKSEEVALIKTLVPKIYAPLVVGQVYDMLEGEEE